MGLLRFLRPRQNPSLLLYRDLVSRARAPMFYGDGGAPDSFDGRFDILVCHLYFVLRRLRGISDAAVFGRDLCEGFFADMDSVLREQGVSDTRVSKHIRNMASAFYGRISAYDVALAGEGLCSGRALAKVLARNLYPDSVGSRDLSLLAGYFMEFASELSDCSVDDIILGHFCVRHSGFSDANVVAG